MRIGRAVRGVGAALCVTAGACGLADFLGLAREPARVFSHKFHRVDAEFACKDCHPKAETSDEADMPSLNKCMLCHEGIDESRPPERKLAALMGDPPQYTSVTKIPDEVMFSHKRHGDAKVGCAECHRGIEESEGITDEVRVSKDACMTCHAERGASNECAACHTAVRRETPPVTHSYNWKRTHGPVSRDAEEPPYSNRCSLCHSQSSCAACHQSEPPENHTNFFRIQGHAVLAGIDRTACAACHRSDFCDRCHQDTAPRTHTASWGNPRNRHCLSCHTPLRNESCALCHKGTPSHALATPMPAWHDPGMNCRQCHGPGLTAPMPHVDNGDSCTGCHTQ